MAITGTAAEHVGPTVSQVLDQSGGVVRIDLHPIGLAGLTGLSGHRTPAVPAPVIS